MPSPLPRPRLVPARPAHLPFAGLFLGACALFGACAGPRPSPEARAEAPLDLARAYERAGRWAEAYTAWEVAAGESPLPLAAQARYHQAVLAKRRLGRPDEARCHLRWILTYAPTTPTAPRALAQLQAGLSPGGREALYQRWYAGLFTPPPRPPLACPPAPAPRAIAPEAPTPPDAALLGPLLLQRWAQTLEAAGGAAEAEGRWLELARRFPLDGRAGPAIEAAAALARASGRPLDAVTRYQWLADGAHPASGRLRGARRDWALFALCETYREAGQTKEALEAAQTLLRRHRGSRHRDDAWASIAELHTEAKRWGPAKKAWEALLRERPDSRHRLRAEEALVLLRAQGAEE